MLNKRGLDRFKKAQAAEPFSVNAAASTQSLVSLQRPGSQVRQQQPLQNFAVLETPVPPPPAGWTGGGASSWQPPDWAVEPKAGVHRLDVIKDGVVLDKIPLEKRRTIFGRQLVMCDYILDHPSVSRQHAAVVQHKNGSIYVIDLGSVHGTLVANERLSKDIPVELEVGQSLRFAASTRSYVLRKADPLEVEEPSSKKRVEKSPEDVETESPRLKRIRTGKCVTFRDDYGGLLAEVVGISDGADVSTEPGPIGVKEGSLVGKYESLVQVTVIPNSQDERSVGSSSQSSLQGVTERLKLYLDKVKSPVRGGLYGDLHGESLAEIKEGSWAEKRAEVDSAPSVKDEYPVPQNDGKLTSSKDSAADASQDGGFSAGGSRSVPRVSKDEDLFTEISDKDVGKSLTEGG